MTYSDWCERGTLSDMTELKRRLSEKVTEAAYLEGLADRSTEDLHAMRDESTQVENELSFERRLCQGRIDILSAELDRRAGRVEGDLISRLPQILADESAASGDVPLPQRPPDFSTPKAAEVDRRRVEELVGETSLARVSKMTDDEIRSSIETIAAQEKNLSGLRKKVHEVLDRIQAEMIRRYTSGEAETPTLRG